MFLQQSLGMPLTSQCYKNSLAALKKNLGDVGDYLYRRKEKAEKSRTKKGLSMLHSAKR